LLQASAREPGTPAMTTTYGLLNGLHIVLALISGLGFALRGFIRVVLDRALVNPLVRFGPHLIDTLLLASGVGLWLILGVSPIAQAWFGLKLLLLAAYIYIGIAAFRAVSAGDRGRAVVLFLLALGLFLTVAWLSIFRPI
jgi:uncharacterized membrane protein SirB2